MSDEPRQYDMQPVGSQRSNKPRKFLFVPKVLERGLPEVIAVCRRWSEDHVGEPATSLPLVSVEEIDRIRDKMPRVGSPAEPSRQPCLDERLKPSRLLRRDNSTDFESTASNPGVVALA